MMRTAFLSSVVAAQLALAWCPSAVAGQVPRVPTISSRYFVTGSAKVITGHYTCKDIVSYDTSTHKMGKVNMEISFTARS